MATDSIFVPASAHEPTYRPVNRTVERVFYSGMAILLSVCVYIGFSPTYFQAGMLRAPLPSPILHIHGTKDGLVPFAATSNGNPFRFPGVEDSIKIWLKVNGCSEEAKVTELPTKEDDLKVIRKDYRTGEEKAPVVLYVVEGGGHTWPGMDRHARFLGAATHNISANDLIWEFFQQFSATRQRIKPIDSDRHLPSASEVERVSVNAPTDDLIFALQMRNGLRRAPFQWVERRPMLGIRCDQQSAIRRDENPS